MLLLHLPCTKMRQGGAHGAHPALQKQPVLLQLAFTYMELGKAGGSGGTAVGGSSTPSTMCTTLPPAVTSAAVTRTVLTAPRTKTPVAFLITVMLWPPAGQDGGSTR